MTRNIQTRIYNKGKKIYETYSTLAPTPKYAQSVAQGQSSNASTPG